MPIHLIIDADACVGYGECVAEDPEAMELDEGGCARVRILHLDEDRAERICAACPVSAISMERISAADAA